jgi:hypothetical protein
LPSELDHIRGHLAALEVPLESESGLRAVMGLDQVSLTVRVDAQDNLLRAVSITQPGAARLARLGNRAWNFLHGYRVALAAWPGSSGQDTKRRACSRGRFRSLRWMLLLRG